MRRHSWFTEGIREESNPGSFGEGLYERYGITGCVFELNCNWAAGLNRSPLGPDWMLLGEQMATVLAAYCREGGAGA